MTAHGTAGDKLVRLGIADVEHRLSVDRSTIWRWYRAGKFPAPHYIGDRRCWSLQEIEQWEAEQIARPATSRRNNLGLHAQAKEPAP